MWLARAATCFRRSFFGRLGLDARRVEDTFSAAYLLALASQMQSELGRAWRAAAAQGKRLATLSISTELRFESAAQRAEFTRALQQAVVSIVGRYASPAKSADGAAAPGRLYRLILGGYPVPSDVPPRTTLRTKAYSGTNYESLQKSEGAGMP